MLDDVLLHDWVNTENRPNVGLYLHRMYIVELQQYFIVFVKPKQILPQF